MTSTTIKRVWAPNATRVGLQIASHILPMAPTDQGWWQVEVPQLSAGTQYGFWVDGKGPYPDPRAYSQPNGVHDLSEHYDHHHYQWQDEGWHNTVPLEQAILYEVHIGTFTPEGTFLAAINQLDYLVDLGITHIELLPVAAFDGQWGWGYDSVCLYAPHAPYGTPDDLKAFVCACHQKGLAVILDVVYNHLGPSGNYLWAFGPYFTSRYPTPWGDALNFDGEQSGAVRDFFIDNALTWLEHYHFDGLRLDAIHMIHDQSEPHFLQVLSNSVAKRGAQLGKQWFLIGEAITNDRDLVVPVVDGGRGLDTQWSDDFHHALHAYITGERAGYYVDFGKLEQMAKALTSGFVFQGEYNQYRNAHYGSNSAGLNASRFLAYSQTHDQVGNRAFGERLSHLVNERLQKLCAAMTLLSPFIPMLFQGEEWSASSPFLYFTNHPDPKLGRAIQRGRQREFKAFFNLDIKIPNPQSKATFKQSKLKWQELEQSHHHSMRQWYTQLIRLRKEHKDLRTASFSKLAVTFNEQEQWLKLTRGAVVAVFNFAKKPLSAPAMQNSGHRLLLTSDKTNSPGLINEQAVNIYTL